MFREAGALDLGDPREVQANALAAALLMPAELIRTQLRDREVDALDEAMVRSLAQRFRVSQQALTIRLVQLGFVAGLGAIASAKMRV
jgi:Zn-dependent peptidase ImmA (M78 family)